MVGSRALICPGAWWCMCCLYDLYQIEDEEAADEVRYWWDENLMHGVWTTAKEAVEHLSKDQGEPHGLEVFKSRYPHVL